MASKFGGVPVEQQGSRFGGQPEQSPTPAPAPAPAAPEQDLSPADRLIIAYRQGRLNPRQKVLVEELAARNQIDLTAPTVPRIPRDAERKRAMEELAQDQGFWGTLGISIGKGFTNVGRGLGLVDEADPAETEAWQALEKEKPITTATGEIIGEAAPFVPAGVAAGGIASLPMRAAASGVVGATEGGVLADDTVKGSVVGGGIGLGAEILFPVIGRLGRKVFQRVTGKAPTGALLTPQGKPTPEFQKVLDQAGMEFDDLTQDAAELIMNAQRGAEPAQVARAARFVDEGIPASRGEVTQDFAQQATEQRILHSAGDPAAEPFRQFKLQQSQVIESKLQNLAGEGFPKERTGELIKEALSGRKRFLRTTKNELYEEFARQSKAQNLDQIPLMTNPVTEVMPDERKLRNLTRISDGNKVQNGMEILAEYGLIEPTEAMAGRIKDPQILTIDNHDDVLQALKSLVRTDDSGAAAVAFNPIIDAIEREADNFVEVLSNMKGIPDDVMNTLKQARKVTRKMKTEFAPRDIAANLIDAKKKGGTAQVTEASKVYDRVFGAGSKVEEVRKLTKLLNQSGDPGAEALGALQSTAILDLIDGGFTTKSMKIAGENVFNPTAFKNRLARLNKDGKLETLFKNKPEVWKKLQNMDKIAADLIPDNRAVPKGSAATAYFNDLIQNLAVAKIPGGTFLLGMFRHVTDPVKTSMAVRRATNATPEVVQMRNLIERQFPGIATALGIPVVAADTEKEGTEQ